MEKCKKVGKGERSENRGRKREDRIRMEGKSEDLSEKRRVGESER